MNQENTILLALSLFTLDACAPTVREYVDGAGGQPATMTNSSMAATGGTGGSQTSSTSSLSTGGMGGSGGGCMIPPPALDQALGACQSPPVTQCTTAFILTNGQSAAQSFTPSMTGKLTKIRLRISNPLYATNTLRLTLVDGGGNISWLAGRSMSEVNAAAIATADASGTQFLDWQDFIFATPPSIVQGGAYAMVVVLNGPANASEHAGWGLYNFWQGAMPDSYAQGRAFACGSGCPAFSEEPAYRDMEFETYVTTTTCP